MTPRLLRQIAHPNGGQCWQSRCLTVLWGWRMTQANHSIEGVYSMEPDGEANVNALWRRGFGKWNDAKVACRLFRCEDCWSGTAEATSRRFRHMGCSRRTESEPWSRSSHTRHVPGGRDLLSRVGQLSWTHDKFNRLFFAEMIIDLLGMAPWPP
jgi:hypothetical protein